jgi:hypothetical protein
MNNSLCTLDVVEGLIKAGKHLILAGEESLLSRLPPGKWIGGTIPYFMTAEGGRVSRDEVFVTELPSFIHNVRCLTYHSAELSTIYDSSGENESSIIILPAESKVHADFALNAPKYPGFATHPLIGWIAGVHLSDIGKATAKVYCGNGKAREDVAVVLRFELPKDRYAQVNIINLFRPGFGDAIVFPSERFSVTNAIVNGKLVNFAEYVAEKKLNTKLPLVADYSGAMVNVSFRSVDPNAGKVSFYAPVWPGIEYRLAAPIEDYVGRFSAELEAAAPSNIAFSCNCILNFLYCSLEGRKTGVTGPITFGEVAYQLLNQTFTYLSIESVPENTDHSTGRRLQ